LRVEVHGADVQDRGGAKGLLQRSRRLYPFVKRVFAPSRRMFAFACQATDGGYAGKLVVWAKDKTNLVLEIIRRPSWAEGFVVIKRRWVVERTFACIMKCRRLGRDYQQLPAVAETLIIIAASAMLLRPWP
jgi:transposase